MPFISQEEKKAKAPAIKSLLKKHNIKGSLSIQNNSTLTLTVQEGPYSFGVNPEYGHREIMFAHNGSDMSEIEKEFVRDALEIMNGGNHDNSDAMTDYFDVGYYVRIQFGKWNKPYILV